MAVDDSLVVSHDAEILRGKATFILSHLSLKILALIDVFRAFKHI